MALPQGNTITVADYLAYDRDSDLKHEFNGTRIIAMTGASWNRNVICLNIGSSLNSQLVDSPCTATANDMRVHIATESAFRYPDVAVVCGKPLFFDNRTDTITNPTVMIEVLSPSTALIDPNEKLREYRQLDSLQVYLLVSQSEPRIERFLRQDRQNWLYTDVVDLAATMDIPPIGCVLALADVYRKIVFE